MNKKDVLEVYNRRKSIKATAMDFGISEYVVRRVLVEYGVIKTPLTQRIQELRAIGLPDKDIAEMLDVSESCVGANSPYIKGSYLFGPNRKI